jgi:glutathione S-transferase
MHGNAAPYRFLAAWTDSVLHAALVRLVVSDIPPLLGEKERPYFIASREARFGMTLAEVTHDREARLPEFRRTIHPLRLALAGRDFLGGARPDYADHIVMGAFMWARGVSPLVLLEPNDAVFAWRERMLDQYGGLARREPSAQP